MPNHETITVPVRLDQKTFKRFAWFDMFILRRGWVRPAIFSLLIPIGAAALLSPKEDAGLIAAVQTALESHTEGAEQSDDITMLALVYHGNG